MRREISTISWEDWVIADDSKYLINHLTLTLNKMWKLIKKQKIKQDLKHFKIDLLFHNKTSVLYK